MTQPDLQPKGQLLDGPPLAGTTVLEMAGIGPGPFAGMLLADLGADVIRVDRTTGSSSLGAADTTNRGKRSIGVDIKSAKGREVILELVGQADVLVEGFRPGVMERAGLGPEACLAANPGLVYGRVTGWGQSGPLALTAGHDLTYLALTGALWGGGRREERPTATLNYVADLAGGSLYMVMGILAALLERDRTGRGQVVDAAMVDGVLNLSAMIQAMRSTGMWRDERGANSIDTGEPFYDVYECSDGKYVAIGALEEKFYRELVDLTGFRASEAAETRYQRHRRGEDRERWAALFASQPREHWCEVTEGTDACLAPVLDWVESEANVHIRARAGNAQPGTLQWPPPAPRLSRTPLRAGTRASAHAQDTDEVLKEFGMTIEDVSDLRNSGAIA